MSLWYHNTLSTNVQRAIVNTIDIKYDCDNR